MRRRRRPPFLLRFAATLAVLWLLACIAVRLGVGRARMERLVGERLGLDISIGRMSLRLTGLRATDISGRLPGDPADSEPVFLAECLRISPRSVRVDDAVLVIVERSYGSTVPACFAACKTDLDGSAPRPCPARILSLFARSLWPTAGKPRSVAILNATLLFRDYQDALHPVFTGLDWHRKWFSLTLEPECRRCTYSSARFRSFGPATSPDGRPADDAPASLEWLEREDGIIQVPWGPKTPCDDDTPSPETSSPLTSSL